MTNSMTVNDYADEAAKHLVGFDALIDSMYAQINKAESVERKLYAIHCAIDCAKFY